MGLKVGIVGLPNAGKSTIFNALTKSGIAAENYPFCTIDPNVGIVHVPDNRLFDLENLFNPKSTVNTIIEFVDRDLEAKRVDKKKKDTKKVTKTEDTKLATA